MAPITINQLKQQAIEVASSASLDVQLQQCVVKTAKSGSPYLQIELADAGDQFSLKIWENLPQFETIQKLEIGAFLRLDGDWIQNQYGIEGVQWQFRLLNEGESDSFLAGDKEIQVTQARDWKTIKNCVEHISDPRLHDLCQLFFSQHQEAFLRTAAAKKNHHARRGGLGEHVSQMMRSATVLSHVYTDLNLDLLIAGILFHDCGKLWENTYQPKGFTQEIDLEGEMLGHIPLGINLVNELWKEMMEKNTKKWDALAPTNEHVRIHLLHLIAAHHGSYEFGSPALPRTPEAHALHHIDNLDAKYEMLKQAYKVAPEIAEGIQQRQFPLPANLVVPLAKFEDPDAEIDLDLNLEIDDLRAKPFTGELF